MTMMQDNSAPRSARGVQNAGRDTKKLQRIMGFSAVSALFTAAPERVEKLFFDRKTKNLAGSFCAGMARVHKPYRLVEADEIERIAGTMLHGGIVALAQPRPVLDFNPDEAAEWAHAKQPLLLLDGVSNPHNFGAITRTAAFLGLRRIVLSGHPAQALPSDSSHRVAEGGMEHVALYRGTPLVQAIKKLRRNYRVIGTAAEGGQPIGSLTPSDRPFALVLGNEEDGIPPETLRACEDIVTIPGSGAVQSLNVSASAAILIYALTALAAADTISLTHRRSPR
jgi:TrmH RNA methyltransferase